MVVSCINRAFFAAVSEKTHFGRNMQPALEQPKTRVDLFTAMRRLLHECKTKFGHT